jgi:WD40 repeat protein
MTDENYYKVGGSLEYQHPTYVVRQADSDLYEGLKNGEFCYVLNSRQMGKSSLRVQMMKKLKEQGVKCASIDMTRIGSHVTPQEWYAGIVSELLRGFGLKKVNFSSWWRERELLPPLQRLRELIEDVLLTEFSQNLVIFIDEIDSIIKIKFKEDFFAFIRACYNQRVDNLEYNRLTFCLLGVATPSDLITDKNVSTPFNIGRAIELTGFQVHEAMPLAQGLQGLASNPQVVIREVLAWTGGQPFLTQKVCKLVLNAEEMIPDGNEAVWVENVVRTRIIENWETQDEPEHLRTIRDRIIWNEQHASRLLGLYQQVLQQGEIAANDTPEQIELRLSGLVVKQQGSLNVYNRIYEAVFNLSWVENELANLRPYSQAIDAWLASNRQDKSRLLRGQALAEALEWKLGKSLSVKDDDFLMASQQLFMLEMQRELEAERETKQILASAIQQAEQLLEEAKQEKQKAEQLLAEAKEGTKIERAGVKALQQFESGLGQIEALLAAMQAGIALRGRVQDSRPLQDYPATSPLFALQQILDQIREQNQFSGHQGWVWSVNFSPNGEYLATASSDHTARLWDLSGKQLMEFKGHVDEVLSISFSPDGQYLATASADGTAKLWDLSGNQLAHFKRHQGEVRSVSYSPNGKYIATGSVDRTVWLWDLSANQLMEFKGHRGEVTSVSFSPNGEYLATGSADRTTRLWDLFGNQLMEFKGHRGVVLSTSFSPDGQYLATASADGTARLWDLSGNQIAELKGQQGGVWGVSFSPDGKYIATASADRTARLWDLSGNQIAELKGHFGWVRSVSFSPDGKYIATASSDRTARLWKLSRNQIVQFKGHHGGVNSVSFSASGDYIATASSDRTARLWKLSRNQIVQFKGHHGGVNSVSFSASGDYIATASSDCTARLWDLSGNQLMEFKGHVGEVTCVSFSPNGEYIATASSDCTARVWDLSGNQLMQFKGHVGEVTCVSYSPNGEYIATASSDRTTRLWDLSGNQLAHFKGHQGWVNSVSFSPNGEYLATASSDSSARLWDLSGNQLAHFKGHQNWVRGVSFSPNGEYIATASTDSTARLWDLSGNQLAQFQGHNDGVWSVSFSPDGKQIATASADGTARLWRVEGLEELLLRGCDWLKDYLANRPEVLEKLEVCRKRINSDCSVS